nr:ROK family protein [Endozoicomonas sp.]
AWECIANHRNRVCGWVLALPRRAWERGGFCDNRLREDDGRGGGCPFATPSSTGVGAGLIINGELQTGLSGLAGHAGHMTLDINGPKCGCGRSGCVEALASGTAIGQLASELYKTDMDAKAVFERYHQGEQDARMIIDRSAQAISELLGNLRALLDIEVAVIGGSVGLAEGYLERIYYFMEHQPSLFQVDLQLAQLGHEAGLKGAALWSAQEWSAQ